MPRLLKKKALLIIGIPGSGKTRLVDAFLHQNSERKFFDNVEDVAENAKDIILTNPYFCFDEVREDVMDKLEEIGYEISVIFFEKDLDKCRENVKLKKGKLLPDLFFKGYNIPVWYKNPLKIWSDKNKIVFERVVAGQIIKEAMELDKMWDFVDKNEIKATSKITKISSIGRPCPNFEDFTRPIFQNGSLIYRHKNVLTEIKKQKKRTYMREYMRGYNRKTTGNWRTILKLNNTNAN